MSDPSGKRSIATMSIEEGNV
uniref:Uncharacterized protein n=1 Tax=Arundo donax TaxID=35708 RepID=A0A0A9ADH5_ARUDO